MHFYSYKPALFAFKRCDVVIRYLIIDFAMRTRVEYKRIDRAESKSDEQMPLIILTLSMEKAEKEKVKKCHALEMRLLFCMVRILFYSE
jgi:hypothetical protein